jgi:hypothetical protein
MQQEDLLKGDVLDPMHWGVSVIDGRLKLFDYGADRVLKEKAEALKEKMLNKQKEMLSKKEDEAEGIYVYDATDEDFEQTSKSTYDIKQAYRINQLVKIAQSVLNIQTAIEPQSSKQIKEIEQKQDEDEYEEYNNDEMLNNREYMTIKATKYDHLLKLANWFTNTIDNVYMNIDQPANKEKVEIILADNKLWPIKSSDFWTVYNGSKADSMKDKIVLVISKDMSTKFESNNQAVANHFNKNFSMLLTRISGVLKTILSRGTYENKDLNIIFSEPEKDIVLEVI